MSGDNRSGNCPTGKVRYENEHEAAIALERVRARRAEHPDEHPPERIFYKCSNPICGGWHLTSRPPALDPPPAKKGDGETWEEYSHRLEQRIQNQRDHIAAVQQLRADAGNRHERKRIEGLQGALGRMTARYDEERQARLGLVEAIRKLQRPADPAAARDVAVALSAEFPGLSAMAEQYDFAERLGGSMSTLHAEADAALRELWMARSSAVEVTQS